MPQGQGQGDGAVRPHPLRPAADRLALDLLLQDGPLTRRQLSDRTGLSRPTATAMLGRLVTAGVATLTDSPTDGLTDSPAPRSRGPVATTYGVPPDAVLCAAVEVGRETLRAQVLDVAGRVVAAAVSAPAAGTAPWRALHEVLGAACGDAGLPPGALAHVVVGIGGAYDPRTDRLANSAHLPGWTGPDLARGLGRRLGLQVVVENDANLALVAELAARDPLPADGGDPLALLWFGDGVGLAVSLAGRVHRGASGRAGEVGYVLAPPPHGDGRRDLQSLLGAGGLEGLAAGCGLPAPTGAPEAAQRVVRLLADAVTLARSEPRGRAARAFLADVADVVATALQPLLAVLDPGTVVLGGPAGPAGGSLLADLVADRLHGQGRWFGLVEPAVAADAVLAGCRRVAAGMSRDLLLDRVAAGAAQVAT